MALPPGVSEWIEQYKSDQPDPMEQIRAAMAADKEAQRQADASAQIQRGVDMFVQRRSGVDTPTAKPIDDNMRAWLTARKIGQEQDQADIARERMASEEDRARMAQEARAAEEEKQRQARSEERAADLEARRSDKETERAWREQQAELDRKARAAGGGPSVIITGPDGNLFRVPTKGGGAATPVVDPEGNPIVKEDAASKEKEAKRKMLSDGQVKTLATYDTGIKMLEGIIADKAGVDTGPVAAKKNSIAHALGIDDPRVSQFKAQVGDSMAKYIQGLSGAAVSDRERVILMQNIPTMADQDETFKAKAAFMMKKLRELRAVELGLMEGQGKDVSGVAPKESKDPSAGTSAADQPPVPGAIKSKSGKWIKQNAQGKWEYL